jgi:hypothetical protein
MARKTTGRAPGRTSYTPSDAERKRVQDLAACGATQLYIAKDLGISNNTLRKHFADDLYAGEIRANVSVAGVMYSMAVDKKHKKVFDAGKFWLTHRAGWKPATATARADQPQGKKEQQAEAARNAGAGTDWGDLLQTPPVKQLQ